MKRRDLLVVGDVGGTNARFALHGASGKALRAETLTSGDFSSLESALARFVGDDRARVASATLGVAGPVVSGRCRATNLPWRIDERVVARALTIPRVTLLNDLVAVGLGAMAAPSRSVTVLQHGRPKARGGTVAVIAPGTGLGEAFFAWDGERHVPCGTEGSHATYAPESELEWRLAAALREAHGHVSWERVASASSLSMLYDWLVRAGAAKAGKGDGKAFALAPDRNGAVVDLFRTGASPAARATMRLFARALGAEAGNLALKTLATGGVYVCGGLAGALGRELVELGFLEAFAAKGRMAHLLVAMPVAVVDDAAIGLRGALKYARAAM